MIDEAHVIGSTGVARFESPAGEAVVVRATGEETDGAYDVLDITIPPGPGVTPLHVHHTNDEATLVLEGELTVRLGDEDRVLGPGEFVNAPSGLPHTYRNSGEVPTRALFVMSPGNNWRYLQEAAEHGPVEDESDLEKLVPILESHDVEVVGPPIEGAPEGGP
jgi:mannose-6-phosphate isomerase-like protein (cupin superfamily)